MSKITEIAFTKSSAPYGWMGNMSRYKIFWEEKMWESTEALFQALRFPEDSPIREEIRLAKNGFEAKQVAKANRTKMSVIPTSDDDLDNMRLCIRLKMEQHKDLRAILIGSGNIPIYEDVTKRGEANSNLIWGAIREEDGTWRGENIMGVLWMELRSKLNNSNEYITEVECERRFLLKMVPHIEFDEILSMNQHYLTEKNSNKLERVRIIDNHNIDETKFIHTIKEPISKMSVNESEKEITDLEYFELRKKSLREIGKVRYIKKFDNLKWEIDEFRNINLVIAEIEIPNEEYDLILPDYIKNNLIIEITGLKEFNNSNLA